MSPTLQADSLPAEPLEKCIITSRSRQIRISLKEKRNLLLLHIKHSQLLLCFVFPALNCYFIPFAYFSFRIFNLQVISYHKDITVSVLGKKTIFASRRCHWIWNVAKPRKLFFIVLSQGTFGLLGIFSPNIYMPI